MNPVKAEKETTHPLKQAENHNNTAEIKQLIDTLGHAVQALSQQKQHQAEQRPASSQNVTKEKYDDVVDAEFSEVK